VLHTPIVPATPRSRSEWIARDDELEEGLSGVHFFLGLSAGAGLSIVSVNPDPAGVDGDFLAEIILGVTAGRFEWRLEVAPVSFVPAFSRAGGYSVMTTFGGLVHLGGPVFWPLRAGAGIWGPIDRDDVYLQAQLDLLGVAFRIGDWMVEVNLPSYRFLGEFSDGVYLYVLTG
jgi:hypothetical protein